MSREAPPSRTFRRRLLHGRGAAIAGLLSSLPHEGIDPVEFRPPALRLGEGDVAVLLLDHPLHGELSAPPPEGLGEGAERLGIVVVGERTGAADPFWPPRVYFSLPEGAADHHVARAVRSVFRFLEERHVAAVAQRALAARNADIENLNRIGIALAAETDPARLIADVLTRARALTQADAGSLYLLERGEDGTEHLGFKAA